MTRLGSPTASLTVTFIEALAQCDIGAKWKDILEKWLLKINGSSQGEMEEVLADIDREDIEQDVALLCLEKCYKESDTKLIIAMRSWELRPAVLAAIRSEGKGVIHTGVAPPGWLEEELPCWVDALSK